MKTLAWYQNDQLWTALSPFLFSSERIHHASVETDQIVQLLDLKPGDLVLDMCCGQGRFALELARRGFQVTGVDRTAAFLEVATANAAAFKGHCEFVLDDALHFCHPETYHAVINLFHSFGYHEQEDENKQVLQNAYRSLMTGGTLLLDMLSKDQILQTARSPLRQQVGHLSLVGSRSFDAANQCVEDRWTLSSGGQRSEFHTSARMYGAEELSAILRSCGFNSVQVRGGLDGRPYAKHEGRLVVIARK
jgi:ubiquinone/menaquinone biosynthesis C-methylase UbiE